MGDYGIKVSKPGYSVLTATPPQLVFSSKYQTPRVHLQGSGTLTHTGGRTVTIAHGLGYVPMFMVHSDVESLSFGVSGTYYPLPFSQGYAYGSPTFNEDVLVWADSTNLYIKAEGDFGYKTFEANDTAEQDDTGYYTGSFGFGHDFNSWGDMNGAIRFGSVSVARYATIYDSQIGFYVNNRYGSSNMYNYIYGIDQDNTADFSTDEPFGRPRTTAVHRPEGNWSAGSLHYVSATNCMQEIVNRSGWSSGNNIGFTFYDEPPDGESPTGNGVYDLVNSDYYLRVLDTDNLLNYKYTIFKDKIE